MRTWSSITFVLSVTCALVSGCSTSSDSVERGAANSSTNGTPRGSSGGSNAVTGGTQSTPATGGRLSSAGSTGGTGVGYSAIGGVAPGGGTWNGTWNGTSNGASTGHAAGAGGSDSPQLAEGGRANGTGGSAGRAGTKVTVAGAGGKPQTGSGGSRQAAGGIVSATAGMSSTKSTGAGGTGAGTKTTIAVKNLPIIKEMPDPLSMNDGTKVTTVEQWKSRRQEMIQILEDYEYGHMPPPPGNVKAATVTAQQRISVTSGLQADYRMLHLTFGPSEQLGFDLGIFMPVTAADGGEKCPVLISLTYGATKTSLADASAALSRGYAVATIPYQQLGADASNWASSAFFPAYPDYDWRDISAWAWGMSRAVDYLVTDPSFDPDKVMITGVSRLGQAVLVAGAFDERIALSAPVAAGAALRFSGKEMGGGLGQGITEVVDQVTYWFGPRFVEFKNQTTRLPCDQHWLPALTAPRLFIMCNSLQDEYGRAYAAAQTYLAAKPVYEFLGVPENIGVHFRSGSHGITSEDWTAILDFADQYLLKKGGSKKFDVLPPADQLP